jgi:hypothetical protein
MCGRTKRGESSALRFQNISDGDSLSLGPLTHEVLTSKVRLKSFLSLSTCFYKIPICSNSTLLVNLSSHLYKHQTIDSQNGTPTTHSQARQEWPSNTSHRFRPYGPFRFLWTSRIRRSSFPGPRQGIRARRNLLGQRGHVWRQRRSDREMVCSHRKAQ